MASDAPNKKMERVSPRARIRDMQGYRIPTSSRMVFATLCDFQDEHGRAFPSVDTLADLSGLSARQVQISLKGLLTDEWVSALTSRSGGRNKSVVYQLHRKPKPRSHFAVADPETLQSLHPSGEKPRSDFAETPKLLPKNPEVTSPEVLNRSSEREVPSSSEPEPIPVLDAELVDADAAPALRENHWPAIEAAISKTQRPYRISFDDRARIEQELRKQGHTVQELLIYLQARGLGGNLNNRCLELLRFVPRFSEAIAEGNHGRYEDRTLDRHELRAEQRRQRFDQMMTDSVRRLRETAGVADDELFCFVCKNTGRTPHKNPRRKSVTMSCTCEAGKRAEAEDDQALLQQGACPVCLARKTQPKCAACGGTGRVNAA
jgi:hypothetical protein